MLWIRVSTGLQRHRKVRELAHDLRLRPVYVVGHLTALWGDVLEQQEDGNLSSWSDDMISMSADYSGDAPRFVSLLQKHGFLDGRIVHDWLEYVGPYLTGKYKTSNLKRLREIWLSHGHQYGKRRKELGSSKEVKRPPRLDEIRGDDKKQPSCAFFELFWQTYPARNGKKVERKVCEKIFSTKIPAVEHANVVKAAENYARSSDAQRNFARNPRGFLTNDFWRDWLTPEQVVKQAAPPAQAPRVDTVKCFVCSKTIEQAKMRAHMDIHEREKESRPKETPDCVREFLGKITPRPTTRPDADLPVDGGREAKAGSSISAIPGETDLANRCDVEPGANSPKGGAA